MKSWRLFFFLLILILPGFFWCPVELCLIIVKNVWEVFVAFADDPSRGRGRGRGSCSSETPESAALKVIGYAAALTALKVTCELYYIHFGVDIYTLAKEGLLTPEDLECRGDEQLRAYVVQVREAKFNEIGGVRKIIFLMLQKSTWENAELIRQVVEDYYREERRGRG
jgi:hypothetical protein